MIELVHVQRQFQSMKDRIMEQLAAVIDSGAYILGPNVERFEAEAAAYLGVKHAIGVANGTDALVLALDACGIGSGDEVITTPYTFFASAESVSRVGAKPVFVDIDPVTYNLRPDLIEQAITPATKAIIPVHLFGQPADMAEIMEIAERHGLIVIEDACQAFGAEYEGKRVGSIGHLACFSFFPTKNLSTLGDGGLITTSDDQLAARIRQLRHHGSKVKYIHECIGYNSRLDELHAAILRIGLEHIDQWNEARRKLAERYYEHLKGHPLITLPKEAEGRKHIYHLFCLESEKREEIVQHLKHSGIQSGVYYPLPLHLQEAYRQLGGQPGDCPVAEAKSQTMFAIPMSPYLTWEEQDQVIAALRQLDGGARE
jgi:dTDP-4-amino-4,6-dideoxygalactose transaminase